MMNQSFYFFYHMTKFLKNILNQSETNFLTSKKHDVKKTRF